MAPGPQAILLHRRLWRRFFVCFLSSLTAVIDYSGTSNWCSLQFYRKVLSSLTGKNLKPEHNRNSDVSMGCRQISGVLKNVGQQGDKYRREYVWPQVSFSSSMESLHLREGWAPEPEAEQGFEMLRFRYFYYSCYRVVRASRFYLFFLKFHILVCFF